MKYNPFVNAFLALSYIVLIVLVMSSFVDGPVEQKAPLLMPIVMLSLLTLSVAVMGYLFVYQPLQLYIDGEKQKAVHLFLRTVGTFAVITAAMLCVIIFLGQ